MSVIENLEIEIPCLGSSCSKKIKKTIGWMKRNTQLTCPSCQTVMDLQSDQFRREVAKAEAALADFMKSVNKTFR